VTGAAWCDVAEPDDPLEEDGRRMTASGLWFAVTVIPPVDTGGV
jgi:hypothetical protein